MLTHTIPILLPVIPFVYLGKTEESYHKFVDRIKHVPFSQDHITLSYVNCRLSYVSFNIQHFVRRYNAIENRLSTATGTNRISSKSNLTLATVWSNYLQKVGKENIMHTKFKGKYNAHETN
jgi:hypothetical protein